MTDLENEVRQLRELYEELKLRTINVENLAQISNSTGRLDNVEFLALSQGANPEDEDATGAYMTSEPQFADSLPTNIGTVRNGAPQCGMNTNGGFYYGGGNVQCDADGEKTQGVNFLRRHDWLDGALAYYVKTGVWKPFGRTEYIYGWQYTNPSPTATERLNTSESATLPTGWSTGDDDTGIQDLDGINVRRLWKIKDGAEGDYANSGYIRFNAITIAAEAVYIIDLNSVECGLRNSGLTERAVFQIRAVYDDDTVEVLYEATGADDFSTLSISRAFEFTFIPDQSKGTFAIEIAGTATGDEPTATGYNAIIRVGHTSAYASITEQAAILRDVFLSSDGLDSSQGLHQESVTLLPEECLQIGLITLTTSESQTILGYYGSRTSPANGDVYTYKFNAKKGTYNIDITYFGSAYNGILDCYLDGVLIDDNYNYRRSSATYNLRNTLTGKAITYNGVHELKFVVVNTAGSNYHFYHTKISLVRTGD